jgi:hypothetical protein
MKGVIIGLIVLAILVLLYFRSSSGFVNEPSQAPTEVVPTQLPPVAPTPPTPVTEPSPVQPQPIPATDATASADGFPESLSMSSFSVNGSELGEVETMTEEIKLVKLKGPDTEDIDMERRQLYTEWSP